MAVHYYTPGQMYPGYIHKSPKVARSYRFTTTYSTMYNPLSFDGESIDLTESPDTYEWSVRKARM